jgi:hypothetical protein
MGGAHGGAWRAFTVACACMATKQDVHGHFKYTTGRPWNTSFECMSRHPNPLSVHRVMADLVWALSAEIMGGDARSSHAAPGTRLASVRIPVIPMPSGAAVGPLRLIVGSPSAVLCSHSAACARSSEQGPSLKRLYSAICRPACAAEGCTAAAGCRSFHYLTRIHRLPPQQRPVTRNSRR